jgi:hypothetical protein
MKISSIAQVRPEPSPTPLACAWSHIQRLDALRKSRISARSWRDSGKVMFCERVKKFGVRLVV